MSDLKKKGNESKTRSKNFMVDNQLNIDNIINLSHNIPCGTVFKGYFRGALNRMSYKEQSIIPF